VTFLRRSYVHEEKRLELCAVRRPWLTKVSVSRQVGPDEELPRKRRRLLEVVSREPRAVSDPPAELAVTRADPVQRDDTVPNRALLVEVTGVRVWWPRAGDLEKCISRVRPWLPHE
jgi:hypothetical protein